MENTAFLRSLNVPAEKVAHCLEVMAKYGDNHWWEPDEDPRKYAYYQLHEETLLGTFSHFHEASELLLGRPIFTHEFGLSVDKLRQEAQRAWAYQIGVTSDTERQERVQTAIQELEDYAEKHGKKIIRISHD